MVGFGLLGVKVGELEVLVIVWLLLIKTNVARKIKNGKIYFCINDTTTLSSIYKTVTASLGI